jgi:hypothetical protein
MFIVLFKLSKTLFADHFSWGSYHQNTPFKWRVKMWSNVTLLFCCRLIVAAVRIAVVVVVVAVAVAVVVAVRIGADAALLLLGLVSVLV